MTWERGGGGSLRMAAMVSAGVSPGHICNDDGGLTQASPNIFKNLMSVCSSALVTLKARSVMVSFTVRHTFPLHRGAKGIITKTGSSLGEYPRPLNTTGFT